MTISSRIPPQDIEAEAAVLGSCLLSVEALSVAMESIDADTFYRSAHGDIFQVMADLFADAESVDMVTVMGRLRDVGKLERIGGPSYIASLTSQIPTVSAMPGYCRRLRDKWTLRKLISHCSDVIDRSYSGASSVEITDYAESGMFDLLSEHSASVKQIAGLIDESIALLQRRCTVEGGITGVTTGFVELDAKLAGMQGGDLLILAGRPSMGKTAFGMNLVRNAAMDQNVPVLVFSLEMSGQQLTERMLSGCALVNGQAMRTGSLSDRDWPKIMEAAAKLKSAPVFIDSGTGVSVIDIRARARRMKSRFGIGLVVVDYLQLMRGITKSGREQEIAEISRGLKSLAKELNIPVLALSQLSRALENRPDKRPVLSDLRESGSIEQDADVVMFIYRDEYYHKSMNNKDKAELIIGKQRSGPIGKVELVFQKHLSIFKSAV